MGASGGKWEAIEGEWRRVEASGGEWRRVEAGCVGSQHRLAAPLQRRAEIIGAEARELEVCHEGLRQGPGAEDLPSEMRVLLA